MTQEETPDDIVEEDGDQPNDQGAESVQNLSLIKLIRYFHIDLATKGIFSKTREGSWVLKSSPF